MWFGSKKPGSLKLSLPKVLKIGKVPEKGKAFSPNHQFSKAVAVSCREDNLDNGGSLWYVAVFNLELGTLNNRCLMDGNVETTICLWSRFGSSN